MRVFAAFLALAMLAGCATAPGTDRLAERDPLEGFNRGVWKVNRGVDTVALKPVSTVYRTVAPKPARRGLSRVLANLSEPFSLINNLLQGKPKRAADNLGRFVVNTTLGVGGLADHATGMGIKPAPEDFGQTLAKWGVNGGPYLVLPILGPSTMRDGVGSGVAQFADPYRVCLRECGLLSGSERFGVTAFEVVSTRADLMDSGADAYLDTSLDPYAAARSAYLQRRRAQILDQEEEGGAPEAEEPIVPSATDGAAEDEPIVPTEADSTAAPAPKGPGAAPITTETRDIASPPAER